jgi:hypothetical protein
MGATASTFAPPTSLGLELVATVIDESREGDGVFWASAPSPATNRQQSRTEAPARDVFSGVTCCLLVSRRLLRDADSTASGYQYGFEYFLASFPRAFRRIFLAANRLSIGDGRSALNIAFRLT